ncbi:fatty acid desaturase [Profundibacter sp.]
MSDRGEWQTLGLIVATYAVWALATVWLAALWLPLAVVVTALTMALHSSLSHEVLHGHPFGNQRLNEALVFAAIGLFIPYIRFRDTHLAHHIDDNLTDPYDDPESNYLDPAVWDRMSPAMRAVLRLNNTLLGRLLIGPVVAQVNFMGADWRLIRAGQSGVAAAWGWHFVGIIPVALWLAYVAQMPLWVYILSAYIGLSILKIRTFLEHRAYGQVTGRTVVIEDQGWLAFMFLNNNLHLVHHLHPGVAWYELPRLYFADPEQFLKQNDGYRYASYGEVFKRYLLRAKDQVPHPIWRSTKEP